MAGTRARSQDQGPGTAGPKPKRSQITELQPRHGGRGDGGRPWAAWGPGGLQEREWPGHNPQRPQARLPSPPSRPEMDESGGRAAPALGACGAPATEHLPRSTPGAPGAACGGHRPCGPAQGLAAWRERGHVKGKAHGGGTGPGRARWQAQGRPGAAWLPSQPLLCTDIGRESWGAVLREPPAPGESARAPCGHQASLSPDPSAGGRGCPGETYPPGRHHSPFPGDRAQGCQPLGLCV